MIGTHKGEYGLQKMIGIQKGKYGSREIKKLTAIIMTRHGVIKK